MSLKCCQTMLSCFLFPSLTRFTDGASPSVGSASVFGQLMPSALYSPIAHSLRGLFSMKTASKRLKHSPTPSSITSAPTLHRSIVRGAGSHLNSRFHLHLQQLTHSLTTPHSPCPVPRSKFPTCSPLHPRKSDGFRRYPPHLLALLHLQTQWTAACSGAVLPTAWESNAAPLQVPPALTSPI